MHINKAVLKKEAAIRIRNTPRIHGIHDVFQFQDGLIIMQERAIVPIRPMENLEPREVKCCA